ncbi:MAG: extensin family protein [Hyphomicrobiaceae bacterium]|nr:extensin family protein [Hyphomicrobiaceae bacterium]
MLRQSAILVAALFFTPAPVMAQATPPEAQALVPQDVPLPTRNPKRLEPPPPPHPRDLKAPEWTAQEIQAALDRCDMLLADIGVDYTPVDPIREGVCGTPAPIELRSIGKKHKISISPPARVTCDLAATLSAWADTVVQAEAQKHLGSNIVSIRNVASYVCRNRYNAPGKRISEHARANALDMAAFTTADGKTITLLDDWALPPDKIEPEKTPALTAGSAQPKSAGSGVVHTQTDANPAGPEQDKPTVNAGEPDEATAAKPAYRPESAFLYGIHEGACKLFGTVLGPLANKAHEDHFHYDLAPRKHGNFCE